MQTLTELTDGFGIPGVLEFVEGNGGLLCARVTSEACKGTVYLHGAHVAEWAPAGAGDVLFLSKESVFAEEKAIRGGVPVVFPWFGPRTGERTDGPMHGFARLQVWDVAFAAVSGGDVHLTLTLGPTEFSRALGYDDFRLVYEVVMGATLTLRLSVVNGGDKELKFEEALHTYLRVGDAEQVKIVGLGGVEYIDKRDGMKRKRQEEEVLTLTGTTDRPYLNTESTVTLEDAVLGRKVVVEKKGSRTTVVWNPWVEVAKTLADFGDDEWKVMTCVETANAAEDAIVLRGSEAHTMEAKISVVGL